MLHEATDSSADQVVALLAVCQDAKEYPQARGILRRALDPAPGTCEPSTRMYNALLRVCAATNNSNEAELHFLEMLAHGDACRPDTETLNCLLKVYTKTHKVLKCVTAFSELTASAKDGGYGVHPDAVTYNHLIAAAHVDDRNGPLAVHFWEEMLAINIFPSHLARRFLAEATVGMKVRVHGGKRAGLEAYNNMALPGMMGSVFVSEEFETERRIQNMCVAYDNGAAGFVKARREAYIEFCEENGIQLYKDAETEENGEMETRGSVMLSEDLEAQGRLRRFEFPTTPSGRKNS
jgi:hypothetical protein